MTMGILMIQVTEPLSMGATTYSNIDNGYFGDDLYPRPYLTYIYLWNVCILSVLTNEKFFIKFPKVFKFLKSFQ